MSVEDIGGAGRIENVFDGCWRPGSETCPWCPKLCFEENWRLHAARASIVCSCAYWVPPVPQLQEGGPVEKTRLEIDRPGMLMIWLNNQIAG